MTDEEFLKGLTARGATVRFAKSGKLHTLDARPIAANLAADELLRIAQLADLRHLELDGAALTDELAASLEQLQSLRHLDLQNTQVTDAALDMFRRMPKLRFLLLTGAPVSKAGIDSLRKSLIGARIVFL